MSLVEQSATNTLPKLLAPQHEERSAGSPACARRTAASGSPTPGATATRMCATSRWGWPRRASSAATSSPCSATTGPASTGRSWPRRRWAAWRCRSTRTSIASELAYVLEHAEVSVIVAEDQEQVDKVLSLAGELPRPAPRRLRGPARHERLQPRWSCSSFADVEAAGRAFAKEHPELFRARAGARPRRGHCAHRLHLGHHRAGRRACC